MYSFKGAVRRTETKKRRTPRRTRPRSLAAACASGSTCAWASASCPWRAEKAHRSNIPSTSSSIRWDVCMRQTCVVDPSWLGRSVRHLVASAHVCMWVCVGQTFDGVKIHAKKYLLFYFVYYVINNRSDKSHWCKNCLPNQDITSEAEDKHSLCFILEKAEKQACVFITCIHLLSGSGGRVFVHVTVK